MDTQRKKHVKNKSRNLITRCPKCRSINPANAIYCYQCGKVFSKKKQEK